MDEVRKLLIVASRDEAIIESIHNIGVTHRIETVNVSMGSSCSAVLNAIKTRREDVAVVAVIDGELGDMRGDILLRRLAMEYSESKFIFVTDNPTVEIEANIRRSGAYFFLAKPVLSSVLTRIVTKAFEHETTRIMAISG